MAVTLRPPLVNVPLEELPIAAAALEQDGLIVAANQRFMRLCGHADPGRFAWRLADVVAELDRPTVEDALYGLTLLDDQAGRRCSVRALRARPPSLGLAIDLARLAPESAVPYLACLRVIPGRRRYERAPNEPREARCGHSPGSCLTSAAAPDVSDSECAESWPGFLMMLSHELRGPLTAILGWARIAESGALPPERLAGACTVIARNAASLSVLVENLFDLSRKATGSLTVTRELLDLNRLVQLVIDSTQPAAERHSVTLTLRCAHPTMFVDGDRLRLEQVVRNLVDNALKFTPAGGHVHVETRCHDGHAEVVVDDSGIGISPSLLPVIFEPFRHDDSSVPPSDRGLGLGLALVRELVQLHDGEVRALSGGAGRGSTFIVRLPLASTAAAA